MAALIPDERLVILANLFFFFQIKISLAMSANSVTTFQTDGAIVLIWYKSTLL